MVLPRLLASWSISFACCTGFANAAPQEEPWFPSPVPQEELRARVESGRPFLDTQWIVRPDGVLTQLPNPAAGGATRQGLSFLGDEAAAGGRDPVVKSLVNRLDDRSGAVRGLAAIVRGGGDLLAATLPERHFAQLGRETSDAALRQMLVVPSEAESPAMIRRELLDRELAVRCLARRGARGAIGELRVLERTTTDPFLRHAVRAALAGFGDGEAPSRVDLAKVVTQVPGGVDVWLYIDFTLLPARPDVAAAARADLERSLAQRLMAVGEGLLDLHLAGAQHMVDLLDELPFELARSWGRMRVDQCLLGFRFVQSQGEPSLAFAWGAASGAFEIDVLDGFVRKPGASVERVDGSLRVVGWWPGFVVEAAPDHVVVRRAGGADGSEAWPEPVRSARAAGDAIAAAHREGCEHAWQWLEPGMRIGMRVTPFRLTLSGSGGEAALAELGRTRLLQFDAAIRRCLPEDGPFAARWFDALQSAGREARVVDGRVQLVVEAADLDPFALLPLLR